MFVFGVAAFLAQPVRAEEGAVEKTPELRGVLAEEKGKRFGLFVPGSGQTGWATIGQTVGGWKLKEYRAADEVLVLTKGDREEVLRLSENVVGTYHPGSAAEAKALLDAMKYEQLWFKDIPRESLMHAGLADPTPAQLAAFQDQMERILTPAKIEPFLTSALSEVYTQEELRAQAVFFGSDVGQVALDQRADGHLEAIREFYASPMGQKVKAKEAVLQARLQKTLRPFLDKALAEVAVAARKFVEDQKTPAK